MSVARRFTKSRRTFQRGVRGSSTEEHGSLGLATSLGIDGSTLRTLAFAAVSSVLAFFTIKAQISRIQKKRRAKARELAKQVSREDPLKDFKGPPGGGRPLFFGIRVVDLSTHVAAPTCARVMAELGAEVLHVEAPEGDSFRSALLDFEQPRSFGTSFEMANYGKWSICLDVKTKKGLTALKGLLRDADVFITNVRPGKLDEIGLDSFSILKEFPHIVYAQLSAWGMIGPERGLAGFDIGAFWTATGFSALVHDSLRHNLYSSVPMGAGDATSGQALLTGISMALSQRIETGRGQFLDVSLLHCGAYCIAPYVNGVLSEDNPEPLKDVFETKDGVEIAIDGTTSGKGLDDFAKRELLIEALSLDLKSDADLDSLKLAARTRIKSLENFEVSKLLSTNGLAHQPVRSMNEIWACAQKLQRSSDIDAFTEKIPVHEKENFLTAILEAAPREIPDLTSKVKLPFDFSCSEKHGARRRAPEKGEHTEAVLKEGWFPRDEESFLPRAKAAFTGQLEPPLEGLVVVELADFDRDETPLALMAAARTLVERGAIVIRVEPRRGDKLKMTNAMLYHMYNAGKDIIPLGNLTVEGNPQLQQILETRADILLTNFGPDKMAQLDIDKESLRSRCPKLSVVSLLPYRSDQNSKHSVLGAFYAAGALADGFYGGQPRESTCPPLAAFELMASVFLCSAVAMVHFHFKRTGEAQTSIVYLDSIPFWLGQWTQCFIHRNPTIKLIRSAEHVHLECPLVTGNSHALKDGRWVQLLGLDASIHLPKILRALGVAWKGWPQIMWTLLRDVVPNKTAENTYERMMPVLIRVNEILRDGMAALTLDEFKKRAVRHDVWYTIIRKPNELIDYEQCKAIGVFATMEHGSQVRVTSPINMQSQRCHI